MNYLLNILIITVSYLIYKIYKKVLPSEGLRNIPTASFLEYTKRHYFKKDPLQKTLREVFLPIADENGIVKVFDIAIQRWIVFVAKPEYFKEIIYKSDISKINSKNRPMSEFELKYIGHDNMLFLIEEEHRRHRRIANPAFRRGWPTKLFGDLIVKLFKEIDKTVEKNPAFDIVSISQKYTLDALGRAAFNYDFGSISNRMTLILDAYNSVTKAMADTTYIIFPILEKIPGFRRPKLMKKLELVNKFLGDIVDEKNREIENSLLLDNKNEKQKESSNNDNKDLLTLMLEAQRNEKGKYVLSKEEIMYDLKLFFLAGHDTTATAISCAVAYMAMHPEYQNKARQEVLSVMNGEELDVVPTSEQIREMKWINMIINETLRLHPPAISLGIRVNRQKLNLGELVIPENTLLLPTIYLQHLSSKLFKDPLKFLPERFDTSNEENNKDPYKFIPFGGGTRICIGMNFSLAEQRVFLAMLLRKYEWTLPDDTIHKNDFIEVHRTYLNLLIPKNLNVNFYKRK